MSRIGRWVWVPGVVVAAGLLAGAALAQEKAAPAKAAHKYIGADKCKACQMSEAKGNQYGMWLKSAHAKAYETLAREKALAYAKEKAMAKPPAGNGGVLGLPRHRARETGRSVRGHLQEGTGRVLRELPRSRLARAAGSRLKVAQATLAQARAQLKQTQLDFDRLTVRAPVAGDVLQVNVRGGEFVSPGEGQPPVVLGETRRLHVRVDIDEADAWRFKPGAKAVAYLRGNSTVAVPATFVRVEPYVTPKKSLTGGSAERVDTRVLQVLFGFDRGDSPIYVGQQMDVFVEALPEPAAAAPRPAEPKS